ncbi:MAG TPA: sugar phosphate isomerase/epimerase family protein [Rugosimonospora sp.]|jgi:sugar phosphate isomerase/epimerase
MSRRLAFSTLGVPGAPLDDVIALARDTGYSGVELRCAEGEPLRPDTPTPRARAIGRLFADAGISVVCVCSYVRIARPDGDPVAEAMRHVELAEALGAPFVRIFGALEGQSDVQERAVERLAVLASQLDGTVSVVIETHDALLTGAAVGHVLAQVDSPWVGALWDVINPWRAGEKPVVTADELAPWLRHVQIKDAASTTDLAPVLPGTGAVPIRESLAQLDRVGYTGWLSLEWERRWYPDAAPLRDALTAFRAMLDPA